MFLSGNLIPEGLLNERKKENLPFQINFVFSWHWSIYYLPLVLSGALIWGTLLWSKRKILYVFIWQLFSKNIVKLQTPLGIFFVQLFIHSLVHSSKIIGILLSGGARSLHLRRLLFSVDKPGLMFWILNILIILHAKL